MAKREKEVALTQSKEGAIFVWADKKILRKLNKVEGLVSIRHYGEFSTVYVDPRYNFAEVINEVKALV